MDYAVFWRDLWLSQVLVVELDGVANAEICGGGIYNFVAAVVVEVYPRSCVVWVCCGWRICIRWG